MAHRTAGTVSTARVSTARGGAIGCCSVNVVVVQLGSRQRQTLVNQRTTVTRPRLGASCNTGQRRPCPTASTPPWTAVLNPIRLDGQHEPLLIIELNFGHVHAWNVEHRIGPGAPARPRPHIQWVTVGAFVRLLGRI